MDGSPPTMTDPFFAVLTEVHEKYQDRSAEYPKNDPWGNGGYRAQLVEMRKKLDRLWVYFSADPDAGHPLKPEDDGIDLIAYAVFFLILFRRGDRDGSWPWPN
jgi:hypothetical protein